MRLPPASGFEGSAVWQLAQSAASVSALPRATVSAEGAACALPKLNAVHKSTTARIARLARCRPWTNLLLLGGVIARNPVGESATSFRAKAARRHKAKIAAALSRMKLRFENAGLQCRDLWCANRGNRHRLVLAIGMTS